MMLQINFPTMICNALALKLYCPMQEYPSTRVFLPQCPLRHSCCAESLSVGPVRKQWTTCVFAYFDLILLPAHTLKTFTINSSPHTATRHCLVIFLLIRAVKYIRDICPITPYLLKFIVPVFHLIFLISSRFSIFSFYSSHIDNITGFAD